MGPGGARIGRSDRLKQQAKHMHPSQLPEDIVARLTQRRGHLHLFKQLDPRRTALVVIDMQDAFLQPGAPS